MIAVTVDTDSPVPPFEQLRTQLADAILGGTVGPGTRLPTVRQLAHDLGLAPNTVAKAYRCLGDDGLVQPDGRRGTKVADGRQLPERERHERLTAAACRYLAEARSLGLTVTDAQRGLTAVSHSAAMSTRFLPGTAIRGHGPEEL
jgi:DNA-binding transcriptional regulator YhcF (GntR family)